MIHVMSFAKGSPFEKYQKINEYTAKIIGGANNVFKYTFKDIPEDYIKKHRNIFSYGRGAGLWLWKPYLVTRTLEIINEGDWLFYNDAACFFVGRIKSLVDFAEKKNKSMLMFELPLLNRQFCKRECYEYLGIKDNGENQVVGTYFLIKKTPDTVKIMKEWLSLCEREELISPNRMRLDIDEFPDFFSHREDQSLLSLICLKYGISLHKECSNFAIFPYEYCYKEFVYNPHIYPDDSYGVILISHRASNPYWYLLHFLKMTLLKKLKIKYTEKEAVDNPKSFLCNAQ